MISEGGVFKYWRSQPKMEKNYSCGSYATQLRVKKKGVKKILPPPEASGHEKPTTSRISKGDESVNSSNNVGLAISR